MSGLLLSEVRPGLPGQIGGIRLLKFTSDCRRFLFADLEMGLTLSEAGKAPLVFDLGTDGMKARAMDRIHDFAFSFDARFAFVAAGLHLRCLDLERGIEVWRYRPANLLGFLQVSPRAVAVTKNHNVFVCNDSGTMELFRPDGLLLARWRASDAPQALSRLHNGDLYAGTDGIGITVWDPEENRRVYRLRSSVRVFALAAFPHEDKVVARTEFGVSVFDLLNGDTLRTFHVPPGLPYIDVAPNGRSFVLGEGRGVAHYDIDGTKLGVHSVEGERILTALFHPLEGHIVAGTDSGGIARFEAR